MGSLTARAPFLLAALAVLAAAPAAAAAGVQLTRIASVTQPTYVAQPPGDSHRLYLTEQPGRVLVLRDGQLLPQPLVDLSRGVGSSGERGLFSLAFAPDFARSRLFYVDFTNRRGDLTLEEFRADATGEHVVAGSGNVLRECQHHAPRIVGAPFEGHPRDSDLRIMVESPITSGGRQFSCHLGGYAATTPPQSA